MIGIALLFLAAALLCAAELPRRLSERIRGYLRTASLVVLVVGCLLPILLQSETFSWH